MPQTAPPPPRIRDRWLAPLAGTKVTSAILQARTAPVILTGLTANWSAFEKWDPQSFLYELEPVPPSSHRTAWPLGFYHTNALRGICSAAWTISAFTLFRSSNSRMIVVLVGEQEVLRRRTRRRDFIRIRHQPGPENGRGVRFCLRDCRRRVCLCDCRRRETRNCLRGLTNCAT